jgi:hypothetical protein
MSDEQIDNRFEKRFDNRFDDRLSEALEELARDDRGSEPSSETSVVMRQRLMAEFARRQVAVAPRQTRLSHFRFRLPVMPLMPSRLVSRVVMAGGATLLATVLFFSFRGWRGAGSPSPSGQDSSRQSVVAVESGVLPQAGGQSNQMQLLPGPVVRAYDRRVGDESVDDESFPDPDQLNFHDSEYLFHLSVSAADLADFGLTETEYDHLEGQEPDQDPGHDPDRVIKAEILMADDGMVRAVFVKPGYRQKPVTTLRF